MSEPNRKTLISALVLILSSVIVWVVFEALYEPKALTEIPKQTFEALRSEYKEQRQIFCGGISKLSDHSPTKRIVVEWNTWQADIVFNRDHPFNPRPVREPDWLKHAISVPELFVLEYIPDSVRDISSVKDSLAKWLLICVYGLTWLIALLCLLASFSGGIPFKDRVIASVIGITVFLFGIQIVEFILRTVNILVFIAFVGLFIVGLLCFYVGKDWLKEKLESGFAESLAETLEPAFLGRAKPSAAQADQKKTSIAALADRPSVSPEVSKIKKETETPPKRTPVRKAKAPPKAAKEKIKKPARKKSKKEKS